jgi:hypothetical protein
MNDRFSNSGKFEYTFPYLPIASGSPFGFFDGLYDFAAERFACKEIARLPQAEAFRLIWEYAGFLAEKGKLFFAVRLPHDEVTLPVINSAFSYLRRLADQFGEGAR